MPSLINLKEGKVNMTKKELEDKISELEKQIVKLKEELNSKIPTGKIWKPKKNELYILEIE